MKKKEEVTSGLPPVGVWHLMEVDQLEIFDIEIKVGLLFFPSMRDSFRHMWE